MAQRDTMTLVVGISFIAIGVLLLLGELSVGILLDVVGIALVVLGILILVKVMPGGTLIGVVALVLGILLMANVVSFPRSLQDEIRAVMRIVNIVVGVVLVVLGVLKLR